VGKNVSNHAAPALAEVLLHEVLRTCGLLRQVQEPYFARFGISGSQWGILRVLQREELAGNRELPLKTVSERLLIQPPSVTGVVDRLERQGLVKRSSSAKDMRVRHLSLTPRGRDLIACVLEGHPERIRSLFAPIPPEEQRTLLGLLDRLNAHLKSLASASLEQPGGVATKTMKETRQRRIPLAAKSPQPATRPARKVQ